MPLEDYITSDEPLGPVKHDDFHDDLKSSTLMTTNVRPFEEVFKTRSSIIIGRKGSGKTSAIRGYRALADYGRTHGRINESDIKNGDHHISVVNWGHFHELVRKVANRAVGEINVAMPEDFISSERLAELWTESIWDIIFQSFHQKMVHQPSLKKEIPSVVALYNSEDIVFRNNHNTTSAVEELYQRSIDEVLSHFRNTKRRCYILIDSMEEYPIRSPLFSRVISGFLKCLNDFSRVYEPFQIIFCLPEELKEFFVKCSSNLVKDFHKAVYLEWRPSDLLRMIAERYRIGLLTIENAVEDEYRERLTEFDFETREGLQEFFSEVMDHEVQNSFGEKEDSLAYMIRHTQLLPRELILMFNRAIKKSKDERGSWRYITASAIRTSIEETETELARHILVPYNMVYPLLIQACENVMPELPAICTKSDLDRIGSRFSRHIEDDISDPWRTLYEMGILGYVEDNPSERVLEGERYIYGFFKFNSQSPIAFRNDALYCIHPLFSKMWSMTRSSEHRSKCVYPANIEHFRARG